MDWVWPVWSPILPQGARKGWRSLWDKKREGLGMTCLAPQFCDRANWEGVGGHLRIEGEGGGYCGDQGGSAQVSGLILTGSEGVPSTPCTLRSGRHYIFLVVWLSSLKKLQTLQYKMHKVQGLSLHGPEAGIQKQKWNPGVPESQDLSWAVFTGILLVQTNLLSHDKADSFPNV